MLRFRLLPWEYGVRNLLRRPTRSLLTMGALTIVVLLVFLVVGFIRGLERSLAVSGDPQVALVFGLGMGENLESALSGVEDPCPCGWTIPPAGVSPRRPTSH